MKKVITLFAAVLMIASFSNTVLADNGATASASAIIVTPISIVKHVDMDFGKVAVQTGLGGKVILAPDGTRTLGVTGGVTLPVTNGTVTAASFTVSGNALSTYSITLPTSALTITHTNGSNTMIVDAFTSNPTNTVGEGVLSASGKQTITVGATLNVAAAQPAGTYISATPFDVTVNYN